MFDNDAKIIERMAPLLRRVLIADPHTANARQLGELIRSIVRCQVWAAPNTDKALKLAGTVEPDLIFVELSAERLDGVEFTAKLRRSALSCRQAPVIIVTGQATAAAILAARDAGVHEFLRRPFTVKDLLRRLEAITLRPRDWIEAVDYVGPDRRRFNSGDYSGPLKRRSDAPVTPDSARTSQALKIVRSAIAAVQKDPVQALRALQTQGLDLQKAGVKAGDMKLTNAAIEFNRYLGQVERAGGFDVAELERRAAPLLAYLPKDESGAVAA
ncbi:response regulator [Phenylobacterium sp.]|uniref:response regulator n=1 Tax=Phenylobacterium sp. TaxID=1871053 RepID=UPI002DE25C63|nr:response regulator [Phenylobacterium sp.]